MKERIIATTHPASYRTPAQGPLGVRLGRIVGFETEAPRKSIT